MQALGIAHERVGEGEAIGHRLAGTGLGGHEQVAAGRLGRQHGALDGGEVDIVAGGESRGELRRNEKFGHVADCPECVRAG